MEHFPSERWVQFTQGLCTAEERNELQRHLADGCEECRQTERFWQIVVEAARREGNYRPPGGEVESAKQAFVLQPKEPRATLGQTIARLVFDSYLQPSLATVRSGISSAQQLVYEAGPLVINIQQQLEPAKFRTFLVGQILSNQDAAMPRHGVEVVLVSGDTEIARTVAGEQGEFDFSMKDEENLSLRIRAPGHEAVWVTLPNRKQE